MEIEDDVSEWVVEDILQSRRRGNTETVVNQDHEGWTMVKTKRAKRRAQIL
jgi:hypothetical protein